MKLLPKIFAAAAFAAGAAQAADRRISVADYRDNRVQRSASGEVVFTLSGRMDEEDIAQLETLIRSEADGLGIALDLQDLILVGRGAISFLERCEANVSH